MTDLITAVRQQLQPELTANSHLYDLKDVERIKSDDWSIERFLVEKKLSVPDAVQMMKETMQYRHSLQLTTLTETCFPREFYLLGTVFSSGSVDRDGNALIFVRSRFHRKIEELKHFGEQFTAFKIEQLDTQVDGRGITVIFDVSNTGYANMDMESLGRFVQAMSKYFPHGLKHVLVYEMLSVFTSVWNLISLWLSVEFRKKVVFVDRKKIRNYISEDNLPFYLGGRCMTNPRIVPDGCLPFSELGLQQGYTEKLIKKSLKTWKPMMELAELEEKELSRAMSESDC